MNVAVGLPENSGQHPTERKIWPALAGLALLLFAVSAAATQYLAARYNYQAALGAPIAGHVYAPWNWFLWANRFYTQDKQHLNILYFAVLGFLASSFLGYGLFIALRVRSAKPIGDLHGSAHWAKRDEIEAAGLMPPAKKGLFAKQAKGAGVYIGGWSDDDGTLHYLRHNGPEHVLAFAPTRSGKGVGLILPTLLSWPESAVVYDLKGENSALTAGWRKQNGSAILIFDPTDTEGRGVGYNPLEEVRIGTEHEVADAQNIVQQIVDPDGRGLDTHWDKTSFMFLVGVILYSIYKYKETSGRYASLTDVSNLLSNELGIDHLYAAMKTNKFGEKGSIHSVIAKSSIDMLEKEPKERGSVLSTAKTFFALYADPVVSKNIAKSGFKIADLTNHTSSVTLYLIVDPANKARLKPLIRLILTQIVRNLTPRLRFARGKAIKPYRHRLLLMLDEFPSLGRLPIFEDALAHIAGYGLKAYLITQDLSQLYAAYGKDEGIFSNCHVRIAYAPNKVETAQLLSAMTGVATVIKRQITTSGGRAAMMLRSATETIQEHERPLLTPDECMRLPGPKKAMKEDNSDEIVEPGDMLIFAAGHAPVYGRQILYFKDPVFSERAAIPPPVRSDVLKK